jgi:SAM-dependent methyltransferase
MTAPSTLDASHWQASWDRQQASYMPDREERFTAMLNVVGAVRSDHAPAILDLAGGTGSISLRVLRRFPDATTTLVDVDPVLQTIARASLDDRTTIVTANLRRPDWVEALPHHSYDAVLTATALHWIPAERLAELYAEVRTVLRPGGVFINADHMPDPGLPMLNERLADVERRYREAVYATGSADSWESWWARIAEDPGLAPLLAERTKVFGGLHAAEFNPPSTWHSEALTNAGFREVGLVWRGGRDAAIAAVH